MFPGLTYIDYCQSILKYDYCWLVCNPVMLLSSIILIIQFGPICVNVYITSILGVSMELVSFISNQTHPKNCHDCCYVNKMIQKSTKYVKP